MQFNKSLDLVLLKLSTQRHRQTVRSSRGRSSEANCSSAPDLPGSVFQIGSGTSVPDSFSESDVTTPLSIFLPITTLGVVTASTSSIAYGFLGGTNGRQLARLSRAAEPRESADFRCGFIFCSEHRRLQMESGLIHCRQHCHRICSASSGTDALGWWGMTRTV